MCLVETLIVCIRDLIYFYYFVTVLVSPIFENKAAQYSSVVAKV